MVRRVACVTGAGVCTSHAHEALASEADLYITGETNLYLWAELHQEELMANWALVMNGEEPFRIQPLQ